MANFTNMKKIIHFNSPEGPVWREETAEDVLLGELMKLEAKKAEELERELHPNADEELPIVDGDGDGDRTPAVDSEPF